ncbi:MAG: TolC family protein [Proteobacteria bacterium]|nr:TolC family protein [Pseudomonadota bacterium]
MNQSHHPWPARRRLATLTLATLALSGCASFSDDGGFGTVAQLSRERIGQAPTHLRTAGQTDSAQARIAELLAQPLTAESAVEMALLGNPALQAGYAELGVAEADRVRAGRLANPTFSFGRKHSDGAVDIDRSLTFNLLSLLTLPLAQQVATQQFEQAQIAAAEATVALATEARMAYFDAVAAAQLLTYHGQVKAAADTAGELARRMAAAGNFNRLDQLREQAFQADATARLARAQQQALAARERLARALGLAQDPAALRLPERLPDLPAAPLAVQDAEQTAMDRRLDVQRAKRTTEATARALGLTQTTRMVNVLHLGYQNSSATGESRANGYEIELELPLFDFGGARVARAEASYLASVHRTAAVAVQARSEVREAHAAYRSAYDIARHYRDEVVPLRKRISDENLLRYNGMFVSVFDLLADAREQVSAVAGAVEALRDHWQAQTRLQAALAGRVPGGGGASAPALTPTSSPSGGH